MERTSKAAKNWTADRLRVVEGEYLEKASEIVLGQRRKTVEASGDLIRSKAIKDVCKHYCDNVVSGDRRESDLRLRLEIACLP